MAFASLNCSHPPSAAATNAGIAGIGVLLGFMVPACASILLAFSLIIQESFFGYNAPGRGHIRRKLLFALSDQQIIYGIGIQAVGLAQMTTLIPYHFFIIWMSSILSTAVHNSSLLVLVCDLQTDKVLRWLRHLLMFANLVLGCVFAIMMVQVVNRNMENSTNPTACAWVDSAPRGDEQGNHTVSMAGTLAVIGGNVVVFTAATWFLNDTKQVAFKWLQLTGIGCMSIIAAMAMARILISSQAFGRPGTPLADKGEVAWSFSTSVTLLMLALPLMTVLEIYRKEGQKSREKESDPEKNYSGGRVPNTPCLHHVPDTIVMGGPTTYTG